MDVVQLVVDVASSHCAPTIFFCLAIMFSAQHKTGSVLNKDSELALLGWSPICKQLAKRSVE